MYPEPIIFGSIMMEWVGWTAKIAATIIGLGFLVFVHELGHFLVAKWNGVRVERFAIGLGKKLIGFQWGETEYALCPIPFGGYVKMAGEYPDQERTGADDEFYSKPPGRRALIVIAGVVMNALVAIPLFVIAFQMGVWMEAPEIALIPGQPAWLAGLQEGDEVLEVDGSEVSNFGDLAHEIAVSSGEVTLKIRRGDKLVTERLSPQENAMLGFRAIGVAPCSTLTVGRVRVKEADEESQVIKGDVLVEANGEKLVSWDHFRRIARRNPGKPVSVTLIRSVGENKSELVVTVFPKSVGGWDLGCVSANDIQISQVRRGDPAWEGGLRKGDVVVSLNGSPTEGVRSFRKSLSLSGGKAVALGIKRDRNTMSVSVTPEYSPVEDRAFIGVMLERDSVVGGVVAGSPAEEIGLKPGDRIIAVKLSSYKKEIEIENWNSLLSAVSASNGEEMILSWKRDGKNFEENIVARHDEKLAVGFLGLESEMKLKRVRLGFLPAVNLGMRNSYMWGKKILQTLHGLIVTRKISFKALSGPVGIPVMGMHFIARGFGTFLYFMGMLGVNFAVINLLPIPIVDGSLLVLLGLEKLRGKPLSIKVQAVIQQVGIAMLIALFLALTWQDVGRFLGR